MQSAYRNNNFSLDILKNRKFILLSVWGSMRTTKLDKEDTPNLQARLKMF